MKILIVGCGKLGMLLAEKLIEENHHVTIIDRDEAVLDKCNETLDDRIRYGRTDKKFCCDECRLKYNYEQVKASKNYRRRVMAALARNYEILEDLLRADVSSVQLLELEGLGFMPGMVTSYQKVSRRDEYTCFDIKYIMTPTRVYGIKKISLNLRVGKNR